MIPFILYHILSKLLFFKQLLNILPDLILLFDYKRKQKILKKPKLS